MFLRNAQQKINKCIDAHVHVGVSSNNTFHLHTGSISSSGYIIPGSNNSFVYLHQVKSLLCRIVPRYSGLVYEEILATCDPKQLNSVDNVWVCVIDVQSEEGTP